MFFLIVLIFLALTGMAMVAIINTLTFSRLKPVPFTALPPPCRLSILIPARNEAAVIGQTMRSLLNQDYPHFEVLLLDDGSTDHTAAIAQAVAQGDPRMRIIGGLPLPRGWLGKNWACHQLARVASGEWFIFADADVRWSPGALATLAAEMNRTQADLLTVWPTQHTVSWGERLVVPLMALTILSYLPALLVHHLPWPSLVAANGQCLAFRRQAYRAVGGHAALRDNILEDVNFARRIKALRLRLRMADGAGLIACRMYPDWSSVRDGFAKNILAGYGGSILLLALGTVFHWLVFLFPWFWLFEFTIYDLRFAIYDFGLTIHNSQFTICFYSSSVWGLGYGCSRRLSPASGSAMRCCSPSRCC